MRKLKLNLKKTIFLDIDGCLIKHNGTLSSQVTKEPELLPGTIEKLDEWEAAEHKIILTTGRKESMRRATEKQMKKLGIFYDQLVMGCNRGTRVIINDKKPDYPELKVAKKIEIDRNIGIKDIKL